MQNPPPTVIVPLLALCTLLPDLAAQERAPTGPLPLVFVENRGQWPTDATWLLRHRSFAARFHDDGIVLQRERQGDAPLGVAIRLAFVGATPTVPVAAAADDGPRVHSFVGARSNWRPDLAAARALRYAGIWPGVDLVVRDSGGELEYDLEVAPGGDLAAVALRAEGGGTPRLADDGSLVLPTALGELRQAAPTTFEVDADGGRRTVPCRFELRGDDTFGFIADRTDPSSALVVDPVVLWASFFGATGNDLPYGLDVAANGDVLVVGQTTSLFTFPVTAGTYQPVFGLGLFDGFVARLDPTLGGSAQLQWCTFFGGSGNDNILAIAEGPSGELGFVGTTVSTDLATTPGALQATNQGGNDAFAAVLSGDGTTLLYGTYLGGPGNDYVQDLAFESDGRIDVCGYGTAAGWPTSVGAFQTTYAGGTYDGWIGQLDRTQTGAAQLTWGTLFGGAAEDVMYELALSPAWPDRVTVVGYSGAHTGPISGFSSGAAGGTDAMIVRFDPSQTGAAQKEMAHYTGWTGNDYGYSLAIEANGDLVIAGQSGGNFPVTAGSFRTTAAAGLDGFLAKITGDGMSIRYATYLGTTASGNPFGIVPSNLEVDANGIATVCGYTSWNLPLTANAIDPVRAGTYEGFVMRFDAPLTQLLFSTYVGGAGDDVVPGRCADVDGDVVTLTCYTTSLALDVQNPYQASQQGGTYDGYLLRFDIGALPEGIAGTPTFATATYPVGTEPNGVVLADLDLDGDLDVATANGGSDDVTLRSNDGAGGFVGAPATIGLAGNLGPTALAAGDFDGDGDADDLAITCADSNTIAIVVDAASAPVVSTLASAGVRPVHLAAGDLDGNGTDDLVSGREGTTIGGGAGIEVALNGAAPVALTIPVGRASRIARVAIADLDGDGNLDVAAIAQGATDEVHLWAGDGLGALTFAGFLPLASQFALGNGIGVADIDFDGDLDLVVVQPVITPAVTQSLRVLRFTGTAPLDAGDYSADPDIAIDGAFGVGVATGDLDSDYVPGFGGGVDAVVVNGSNSVTGLYGFQGASALFGATGAIPAGSGPVAVALGDLDGDQTVDLAIANRIDGSVTIHRTDGALARSFGTGCPGQGGIVPQIGALGLPRLGTQFSVQVTQARPLAPAFLAAGLGYNPLALGGGCTFYVDLLIGTLLRFTDASGQALSAEFVPNAPALLGLDIFYQWAVFDPAGAYQGLVAFSDGLRAQVGQ
ncbi:MAG: VCBS repeat-containing protein [Planctomycetes bacterium]|nr:VCBS repeat-containing protein [Planctomycetota bacterium]